MEKLIIIGSGGHACSVLDIILDNNIWKDIIFLDEYSDDKKSILNFPVVKKYNVTSESVFIAIGNNEIRRNESIKYYDNLISIIAKDAYIGKNVEIGKGVFIGHKAHIGVFSIVSDFCLINTCASIDHECFLDEASFVAPNATLCGNVSIGKYSFIGAGAPVIENIKITEKVIVAAGSVARKDITISDIYPPPIKIYSSFIYLHKTPNLLIKLYKFLFEYTVKIYFFKEIAQ